MYKPKTYPEHGYEIDYDFKNPALCKVNGVIHSYCCICKTYIGNEDDTDWNSCKLTSKTSKMKKAG